MCPQGELLIISLSVFTYKEGIKLPYRFVKRNVITHKVLNGVLHG